MRETELIAHAQNKEEVMMHSLELVFPAKWHCIQHAACCTHETECHSPHASHPHCTQCSFPPPSAQVSAKAQPQAEAAFHTQNTAMITALRTPPPPPRLFSLPGFVCRCHHPPAPPKRRAHGFFAAVNLCPVPERVPARLNAHCGRPPCDHRAAGARAFIREGQGGRAGAC